MWLHCKAVGSGTFPFLEGLPGNLKSILSLPPSGDIDHGFPHGFCAVAFLFFMANLGIVKPLLTAKFGRQQEARVL